MRKQIQTGYELPFAVEFGGAHIFVSNTPVYGVARMSLLTDEKRQTVTDLLELFSKLACTGAMSGKSLHPEGSRVHLEEPIRFAESHCQFILRDVALDPRSLIIFTNLLLAHQDTLKTELLRLFPEGSQPTEKLQRSPDASTYPEIWAHLPFEFTDEEPEGGGYTFTAELREPLREDSALMLNASLGIWTEAVKAGAYGLAPIHPEESYAEPYEPTVTSFDTTVEWTVFKVRADPACINGIVNIFGAFHGRCQEIASLTIS